VLGIALIPIAIRKGGPLSKAFGNALIRVGTVINEYVDSDVKPREVVAQPEPEPEPKPIERPKKSATKKNP
jgi:hypothetical protein